MFNMTHKSTIELSRSYPTDAGLDIKSIEDAIVPAFDSLLVHTGLHIAIKEGFVGMLKSRSGLAVKHGIDVAAGIIDAAYRGEVNVVLRNNSDQDFYVSPGDRIAQLITFPICLDAYEVVEYLDKSDRGDSGFGSTGR
jgi:dUTP pyrophosphatase